MNVAWESPTCNRAGKLMWQEVHKCTSEMNERCVNRQFVYQMCLENVLKMCPHFKTAKEIFVKFLCLTLNIPRGVL